MWLCFNFSSFSFSSFFVSSFLRHHGSLSTCPSGSPSPLTSAPFPHLFLHLSLSRLSLFLLTPTLTAPTSVTQGYHSAFPTKWQGRKAQLSEAQWTSSAWRASFREEQAACWSLIVGRFLSTIHHTCKVPSMCAAPNWWRGDCSRTRCPSLSCCNSTAKWRWV